jgi:hypothetical protein
VKAITVPVRSRSMIALDRKGERHAEIAMEKSVATLDTNSRYFASERRWQCVQKECPCEKHTRSCVSTST